MEFTILFGIIPFISIVLLFIWDAHKTRKIILNILLVLNALVFSLPMMASYLSTPEGESMFNENTGGGTFLWFYMILFPACGFALFILAILKSVFWFLSRQEASKA